jgi:hypothetical protein
MMRSYLATQIYVRFLIGFFKKKIHRQYLQILFNFGIINFKCFSYSANFNLIFIFFSAVPHLQISSNNFQHIFFDSCPLLFIIKLNIAIIAMIILQFYVYSNFIVHKLI